MKLINAWLGNNGEPVPCTLRGRDKKTVERYQVRWKLDPGNGRMGIERKRTDFNTKAETKLFIDQLHRASFGVDGWTFDSDGQPVKGDAQSLTLFHCVEQYMASRWSEWKPGQRGKVRGRLVKTVALTLIQPADRDAMLTELPKWSAGLKPKPMTSDLQRAARYLAQIAFYPKLDDSLDAGGADATVGRRWIEARSLPITSFGLADAISLRAGLCDGQARKTQRTYWSGIIVPFFNWTLQAQHLHRDPLAGMPKMKRDVESERPDRRNIPDPDELAELGAGFRRHRGESWEMFILLKGYCALRTGEALGIKFNSFHREESGRWYLDVVEQEVEMVKATSDDGATTRARTGTKASRDRTPPPRPIPVPTHVVVRLLALFGDRLGADDAYMFVTPRGKVPSQDTFRTWWKVVVVEVFGDHPTLSAITPHTLRHAGMTYWFAAGVDHKRCQKWGGWTSLKEMLDTYRGVIDSLEEQTLDDLDRFHTGWTGSRRSKTDDDVAEVIDLNMARADATFSRHRQA